MSAFSISPDFARSGLSFGDTSAGITQFHVMGERSSGTNLLHRLILRNTALTPAAGLGWKHGFVQGTTLPRNVLILGIVRDAESWSLAMHRRPWHCPRAMQKLRFEDFVQARWETVADRPRYFPGLTEADRGKPLLLDRDPATLAPFDTLFALRRAKLAHLLAVMQQGEATVLVSLRHLQNDPEGILRNITTHFDLTPNAVFRPVRKRLGQRFKPALSTRPDSPKTVPPVVRVQMSQQLDLALESALGFDYAVQAEPVAAISL